MIKRPIVFIPSSHGTVEEEGKILAKGQASSTPSSRPSQFGKRNGILADYLDRTTWFLETELQEQTCRHEDMLFQLASILKSCEGLAAQLLILSIDSCVFDKIPIPPTPSVQLRQGRLWTQITELRERAATSKSIVFSAEESEVEERLQEQSRLNTEIGRLSYEIAAMKGTISDKQLFAKKMAAALTALTSLQEETETLFGNLFEDEPKDLFEEQQLIIEEVNMAFPFPDDNLEQAVYYNPPHYGFRNPELAAWATKLDRSSSSFPFPNTSLTDDDLAELQLRLDENEVEELEYDYQQYLLKRLRFMETRDPILREMLSYRQKVCSWYISPRAPKHLHEMMEVIQLELEQLYSKWSMFYTSPTKLCQQINCLEQKLQQRKPHPAGHSSRHKPLHTASQTLESQADAKLYQRGQSSSSGSSQTTRQTYRPRSDVQASNSEFSHSASRPYLAEREKRPGS